MEAMEAMDAVEEYGDELFIYAMALREQVDNDKAQAEQDGKQDKVP